MLDPSSSLTIDAEPLSSDAARTLIGKLDSELTERYPDPADRHFALSPEQVTGGGGTFLVARMAGEPVGCAALRRIDNTTGELKRMYVTPASRGLGIGRRLLAELERYAVELGLQRLVLETGADQPEALALYEHAGFTRIDRFGEYVDSPASICLGKPIDR